MHSSSLGSACRDTPTQQVWAIGQVTSGKGRLGAPHVQREGGALLIQREGVHLQQAHVYVLEHLHCQAATQNESLGLKLDQQIMPCMRSCWNAVVGSI